MTWDEWISRHAELHGLSYDGDLRTLAAWADLLERDGYSAAEMAAASEALLRSPPRRLGEAFASLRRLAGEHRLSQAAQGAPRRQSAPCELCGGAGSVPAPHPSEPHRWCDLLCPCGGCDPSTLPSPFAPRDYVSSCSGWGDRLDASVRHLGGMPSGFAALARGYLTRARRIMEAASAASGREG